MAVSLRNIEAGAALFRPLWIGCLLWLAGCASDPAMPPPSEDASYDAAELETAPEPPQPIRFTIQLGAFSTSRRAAAFTERLAAQGFDAYAFIDVDGLWKVRFGRFDTREEAVRHGDALKNDGAIESYYVVRPVAQGRQIDSRTALRDSIVSTAQRFIGAPYRWGGASGRTGFDCSGLTMTVYRLNGYELPRSAASQYRTGRPVQRRSLQRGDLVFFQTNRSSRVSHVGIYTGQGEFIHAPGRGKRIRTSSLSNRYFAARYIGARRYI
jgi:cell wall-associated NlpC family hydrolase